MEEAEDWTQNWIYVLGRFTDKPRKENCEDQPTRRAALVAKGLDTGSAQSLLGHNSRVGSDTKPLPDQVSMRVLTHPAQTRPHKRDVATSSRFFALLDLTTRV